MNGEPLDWNQLGGKDRDMLLSLANLDDEDLLVANRSSSDLCAVDVLQLDKQARSTRAATIMIDEPQILAATSAVLPPSARRGSEGLARPNTPGNFQRGQTTTVRTASRGSLLARIAAPLCILFGLLYFAGAQWYYASTESASQLRNCATISYRIGIVRNL